MTLLTQASKVVAVVAIALLLSACGASDPQPAEATKEATNIEEPASTVAPEPETVSAPTAVELCEMVPFAQVNSAIAWSGVAMDPAASTHNETHNPKCYIEPTEIDFDAPVFNLSLESFPLDFEFGGQQGEDYDRNQLPALWAADNRNVRQSEVSGVTVYTLDHYLVYAFLPDYTLLLSGFGDGNNPQYGASLEAIMAHILETI